MATKGWLHARANSHGSAYSKPTALDSCVKCGMTIASECISAFGDLYHPQCFKCHDCHRPIYREFFPVQERNGPVPLCENDLFRRLDMLCSECGGALRDLYISAVGRKYHMDHFTCHSCQHVIGPGDNYYIHRGKAYCKNDYMAKYADRCYGCGMAIMDQYIKVYMPTKRVWHERCYKTHKRHNPGSSLDHIPVMEEQDDESACHRMESILNNFESTVTSCISDNLEHLESGSHEKISEGILTLIIALGVLFTSIDIVDDIRRKAAKTILSDSPEIDLLRAKLTDLMTVSLSKSHQPRTISSHLKEIYAASSGLSYFMKKVIKILGEGAADVDLSAVPEYLSSLDKFPNDLPPTMSFTETELNRGDVELCHVCNRPISAECVSWDGYLRRQHLTCKGSCVHCDTCETPQNTNLVLISPPGDSYALCCTSCQSVDILGSRSTDSSSVKSCKYITKLQQYVFLLRAQFEQLRYPEDVCYNYTQTTMATETTVTAVTSTTTTTTMTALFERSHKQLDKGIFGRLSTNSHRTVSEQPVANNPIDRTASDTFALGTMIGSSYQGLKKGFFSRSKAR
ncbi:leupaxin [Histoplasma capsulatum var. duboisii H88]|uniref:Leupaxin n=2 Tax=Ajellomyces capsulatus TaxID=5037 RepID=F0UT74_AJEC8|nr:leupaxin [Histoplasma capsulatum H143]EGC49101.1 leupaxin [Histoplasma capsulatum var. duboisii H88]QSS54700.1 leupaxin [Histoplasma capsulatum var. duboisii H88]